ncbi:MAG: hypothetical protein IKQ92_03160 [Clostridia bacterium]|nr:hypothetical protein [Clostridia bacterium]
MIYCCRSCKGLFDHIPVREDIKCPYCKSTTVIWSRRQIAVEEAALLMAKQAERDAKRKNRKPSGRKQKESPPEIPPSLDDKVKEEIAAVRPATKEEAKLARSEFYEPPDIVWEDEPESPELDWDDQRTPSFDEIRMREDPYAPNNQSANKAGFAVDEDGLPIDDGEDEDFSYAERSLKPPDTRWFPDEDTSSFWSDGDEDFIDDDTDFLWADRDETFWADDSSDFWSDDEGDFIDDLPIKDSDEKPLHRILFSDEFESQIPFRSKKQEKQEIKPWRKRPSAGKRKKTA